jgi:hypothetical protein
MDIVGFTGETVSIPYTLQVNPAIGSYLGSTNSDNNPAVVANEVKPAKVNLLPNPFKTPRGQATVDQSQIYSGSLQDRWKTDVWNPLTGTINKMTTDPKGSIDTATNAYGIDIPKYGVYIILFGIILLAILGLILPEAAKVEGV